ncbi:serine/threonine protein phosphatase 1 [Rhizobium tibeticum]|uniref:Bis(5'-nucleosyl)-tetraphosphatase PrpE n=1 Tax=Rhizobium tibeticum TaxID=501024 RepID=A0A1H8J5W6_9HYPH|nr:metallophosphoesterase [Rhizobium tibeticum]SEH74843.1 Bis(5'-nucleosyl)-tetraphosphatase PrpE [Rhizobium tibeticum]SEN75991.1 serine/threonine protein phosphatase 1 [Rhizobium tibeticum]
MPSTVRERLKLDPGDIPIYAIGDIHGRHDLLQKAEQAIVEDAAAIPGRKLIITLGDYIDRGPSSAQVISHLMGPPPKNFDRICLTGNHEITMLDYLDGLVSFSDWMRMGSDALLRSYGLDAEQLPLVFSTAAKLDGFIRQSIPKPHVDFLRSLPIFVDTPSVLFVHAGIDPMLPIEAQSDDDLVFIRHRFFESRRPLPKVIVHGHTPNDEPEVLPKRLNLDTGAFHSGKLTVARLWKGRVHLFQT